MSKKNIKLVILPRYKNKILLNNKKKCCNFFYIELKVKDQPEFVINEFLQKRIAIVPEKINVKKVINNAEDINIIYEATIEKKDYIECMQKDNYVWIDSEKVSFDGDLVVYDNTVNEFKAGDQKYILYTDGGSRGNPGHSSIGYAIFNKGDQIYSKSEYIGITTSAISEYQALVRGLEKSIELGVKVLECRLDNLMIVKQLNHKYKVKNRELIPINEKINLLIKEFSKIRFIHIKREFNQIADSLVNEALDEYLLKK